MKYGRGSTRCGRVRTPGKRTGRRCARRGLISEAEANNLPRAYDFLLRVQSRLRIVHNRTLDELPDAPEEIDKLARRLGYDTGERFLAELERHRGQTRELFLRLVVRDARLRRRLLWRCGDFG